MKPSYEPATPDDLEALVELRIEAMRESLTAIGRFDPLRARARFSRNFEPATTRHIVLNGVRVGFFVVKSTEEGLRLDHLYLRSTAQGQGLGSAVLSDVIADADERRLPLHVGALRGSPANRFYERHGFVRVAEDDWDIYYRRDPVTAARRSS
jgi:GNAT superfamily N-acetyltransferase